MSATPKKTEQKAMIQLIYKSTYLVQGSKFSRVILKLKDLKLKKRKQRQLKMTKTNLIMKVEIKTWPALSQKSRRMWSHQTNKMKKKAFQIMNHMIGP